MKLLDWLKSIFLTQKAIKVPAEQPVVAVAESAPAIEFDEDIDIMARTIWGESRGEGYQGMQAVACVIMNRYKENIWYSKIGNNHSIKSVCLKKAQFSCWNEDDRNSSMCKAVTESNKEFKVALEIAKSAKSGELQDFTGGANHYFADYIEKPSWAKDMQFCITIGHHNFYKG